MGRRLEAPGARLADMAEGHRRACEAGRRGEKRWSPSPVAPTWASRRSSTHCAATRWRSHRPCRTRLAGASSGSLTVTGWQLVLVDLPGFQRPLDALTEADAGDRRRLFRGRRRRAARRQRTRSHRRRRPVRRAARVLARRAGDHRREQDRPPHARSRGDADEDRGDAGRLPRAAPGEREDEGRDRTSSAATSSSLLPGRAGAVPGRSARPTSRRRSGWPR